jgi:1-acyl-sn-glycerol-3-phosphate acyltransferase
MISDRGIKQAMAWFLDKINCVYTVEGLTPETITILRTKPVLLISNHQGIDMIPIFAAIPERKDCYLIAASDFKHMGSNISKRIIPIYIRTQTRNTSPKLSTHIGKFLHFGPRLDGDVAHRKNIESISQAAAVINKGGLVLIFPEGAHCGGEWFSGVGYLASELNRDAYIININVKGATKRKY